jgi:septation ring formation regulator EzrA
MNTEKIFEGPGQSSMETYVIEIVIILIIAFMLGYFFCVLIKKSQKNRIKQLKKENQELKNKLSLNKVDQTKDGGL